MTRRGTLAYYLAAWVIGCFVVSFLLWIGEALAGEIQTASILLTTYFFSLVFGAIAILLFAFLLRRSMRLLRTHALWAWLVSGATLGWLQIFLLIHAQSALLSIRSGEFGEFLFAAVLKAADVLEGRNLWQAPVDGAITAVVLCLVDRAFAGPNEAAEPKHSPA
jgi:prepilin signal peptidase PulO-like enzyme (type II secretory pathway)